jgi:hypothetical protein
MTFSVPKSITILGAAFERMENDAHNAGQLEAAEAWGNYREAVEDAAYAGARASIDYLADEAGYSRVGKGGSGQMRYTDAHNLVVAELLQQDS